MGLRTLLGKLHYFFCRTGDPRENCRRRGRDKRICQLMHKCSKISSSSSVEKFSILAWFSLTSISSFTMLIFQALLGNTGAYSKLSMSLDFTSSIVCLSSKSMIFLRLEPVVLLLSALTSLRSLRGNFLGDFSI